MTRNHPIRRHRRDTVSEPAKVRGNVDALYQGPPRGPTFLAGQSLSFSFDGSQFTEIVSEADGPINWARFHDHLGRTVCDVDLLAASADPSVQAPCDQCGQAKRPPDDRPSVRRACAQCGHAQFHYSQNPTQGPHVAKGEPIIVPSSMLTLHMRFAGGASFTRPGIDWLAREFLGFSAGRSVEAMLNFLGAWKTLADNLLREDPLAPLLESESPADHARAAESITKNPESNTLATFLVSAKVDALRELLLQADEGTRAVALEVFRVSTAQGLMAFRFAAEEACFRGNALERLRWFVSHCRKNLENSDESFWQKLILDNPFAITHLFASPVVIHGDEYYVGGIRAGGKHGKLTDFVLKNKLTASAIILEIKTPTASLLRETEYRQDVFVPSQDLGGAVQQVLEQRAQFTKHIDGLQADLEPTEPRLESGIPECVVLIGNAARDLTTRARRRSFESYRGELRTVRVVAFDELFARIDSLLELLDGPTHADTSA